MNPILQALVGFVSGAAAPAARVVSAICGPLVRVGRLTMLRGKVRGSIPVTTQFDGSVHAVDRPFVILGTSCRVGRDVQFETGPEGTIRIGSHVRMSAGVHIVAYAAVSIGDHCLIGEYTSIRDANHGMEPNSPYRTQPHTSAPITIGTNVWIGRGTVVLAGVSIGDDAVIGANSVVTHSIPRGSIAVGSPARVIRVVGARESAPGLDSRHSVG